MDSLGSALFSALSLGPLDVEILEEFVVVVSQTSSAHSVFSQSDPLEQVIEVLLSCATISSWPIVAIRTVMDNMPTTITNLQDDTNLDILHHCQSDLIALIHLSSVNWNRCFY